MKKLLTVFLGTFFCLLSISWTVFANEKRAPNPIVIKTKHGNLNSQTIENAFYAPIRVTDIKLKPYSFDAYIVATLNDDGTKENCELRLGSQTARVYGCTFEGAYKLEQLFNVEDRDLVDLSNPY